MYNVMYEDYNTFKAYIVYPLLHKESSPHSTQEQEFSKHFWKMHVHEECTINV